MGFSELASYIWLQQAFLSMLNSWAFENDIFEAISTETSPMSCAALWGFTASGS